MKNFFAKNFYMILFTFWVAVAAYHGVAAYGKHQLDTYLFALLVGHILTDNYRKAKQESKDNAPKSKNKKGT